MKRFVFVAMFIVLVVILARGCGARGQVAKDKVLARIDNILGSLDVKRKEIELAVGSVKEGIEGLRRAKIKAQVCGDQIARKAKPEEQKLVNMDEALKELRKYLQSSDPVEIAGKTYRPAELKEMADRVLQARKTCAAQLEALHGAQARLQKVVVTLDRKQQEVQTRLADIEGQVAVIDSNRIALTALQQSAAAMSENDASLSKSLDRLQEKVSSLFVDVESELRFEDDKWGEVATKEINSVDGVVASLQSSHDTVSEIDQILGNSKK